jgi:hypothetical protein
LISARPYRSVCRPQERIYQTRAGGARRYGAGPTLGDVSSDPTRRSPAVAAEPADAAHFAWTGPEGATVYITGHGPTDTRYVEAGNDPAAGGTGKP